MEENLLSEEANCAPSREKFFNEEFGYALITSVVVCTYAIINVVSLVA